jgi:hypothetical protein
MKGLFVHTLVLGLVSHRIAAHEQSGSDLRTASPLGEVHLSGERGTACKCGKIPGPASEAHSIAGIVEGCELGDSATTGTAGQAGRLIGRSIKMPAPENR